MQNIKSFDISVEEFDAINEEHVFSDRYNKRKAAVLKSYKDRKLNKHNAGALKAAAAVLIALIVLPLGVNAAMNGELFKRIWGTQGKEDIEPHVESMVEEAKGTEIETAFPKIEYEDIDESKAEELIGKNVSFTTVSETMGDTTIDVLSVVYDGNAIVAEYIISRKGGVNCFDYSQIRNECKGALLREDVPFRFWFKEGSGKIYVDLARSDDERLYCYEYMADEHTMLGSAAAGMGYGAITDHVSLCIEEFSEPISNFIDKDEDYEKYLTDSREISIPLKEKVETSSLVDANGEVLEVSPISMKTPAAYKGGMDGTVIEDELFIYHVSINYKDGSSYTVLDENIPHDPALADRCAVETANYQYIVGGIDGDFIIIFNRLVDTGAIESITVNDTTYM